MGWPFFRQRKPAAPSAVSFVPKVTTIVSTDSKGEVRAMRPTKEVIFRIFNEVEADPLAGMGIYSKREIAADKIMQLLNTSELPEGRPSGSAAPLFTEPGTTGVKGQPTPGAKTGDKTA